MQEPSLPILLMTDSIRFAFLVVALVFGKQVSVALLPIPFLGLLAVLFVNSPVYPFVIGYLFTRFIRVWRFTVLLAEFIFAALLAEGFLKFTRLGGPSSYGVASIIDAPTWLLVAKFASYDATFAIIGAVVAVIFLKRRAKKGRAVDGTD
jgi:hypothetical protein